MSQAGANSSSGGGGGGSEITFVTDDGSAVTVSQTLNLTGIDSTENNDNGILVRADPNGSDDAFVVLTNRLQGTGSTSGAVTDDIITFDLGATPGTWKFSFSVAAFESTTPAGAGYEVNASARTTGASATIISIPDGDEDEDAALNDADWDVIASGNNIILRVTGVSGLDIDWGAVGEYVRIL